MGTGLALAVLASLALGCAPAPPPAKSVARAEASSAAPAAPEAASCPAPRVAGGRWRHVRTALTIMQGPPHHGAIDAVVGPAGSARIEAKLAYGPASKDLEDEDVALFVEAALGDRCSDWRPLGIARTDGDGWARFEVPAARLGDGHHRLALVVGGDQSRAEAQVFVVPPGRRAVVFDIDGTLTTGDDEIVEQVLVGDSPEMYPGADRVARAHHEAGYFVVYLTRRPVQLAAITRAWLSERGFPPGPVLTAPGLREALPSAEGVGRFKREALRRLQREAGLSFERAYGNAVTDICAYAEAGIDPGRTFIVGRHGGEACGDAAATWPLAGYAHHQPNLTPAGIMAGEATSTP